MKSNTIDIVIPWVDSSDPKWQEDYMKFACEQRNVDANIHRYRDNGLLKFWFRGIEKNAPWIRKVHFITYGHVPAWLKQDHPKLHIVKHSDYIPQKYLPTFNSHVIELNLHKIDGLSDKFIYYNDDTFLINPVDESFYFKNGKPRDCAILNAVQPDGLSHVILNNLSIINKHFCKKQVIRKNILKWINVKYGAALSRTICLMPWPKFVGIKDTHLPIPYLKSTFDKLWELEPEILNATNRSKFRQNSDINQYLFRYWQLVSGEFECSNTMASSAYLDIGKDSIIKIRKELFCSRNKLVVINDADTLEFDSKTKKIQEEFAKIFPFKSTFEL